MSVLNFKFSDVCLDRALGGRAASIFDVFCFCSFCSFRLVSNAAEQNELVDGGHAGAITFILQ